MIACPVCKSIATQYLDLITVTQELTQNILPPTYKVLKCKKCGIYFKNYIPDNNELNNFYNSLGEKAWDYQIIYPHEEYLKIKLNQLPDLSNVLDVGCNTGRLLENEVDRLNCFGIEINKEAASIAEGKGIKILTKNINDDILSSNTFDLITLIDVFEHLNDPLPFIDKLIKALKPGGKLYIFTGRTDCFPAMICRSYYWYFKPAQHIIFLNSQFIKWYSKFNVNVKVSIKPMRHFRSSIKKLIYQISWHLAWRYFSPNSPYKIFALRSFAKLKEPFMITAWKDHVFFIIEKK